MGVEYASISFLASALGRMPLELRAALRPKLRDAGNIIADKARANASWSSRIPRAISVSSKLTRNGGVVIKVSSKIAPHGRPYEGVGTRGDYFRAPLFGDREHWYPHEKRPYLLPALREKATEAKAKIAEAVIAVTRL